VYLQFVTSALSQVAGTITPEAPKATNGVAGQLQHYSRKQLRLLIASAAKADDYKVLANYFHHQELVFRNKAQRTLDEYAAHAGRYPMATKFVTKAEVAARLYDDYVSKADENARLAAQYDEKLAEMGIEPERESATIISIKSLQSPPADRRSSALLENLKRSSTPPDPHE
jgi:hypothetical protein